MNNLLKALVFFSLFTSFFPGRLSAQPDIVLDWAKSTFSGPGGGDDAGFDIAVDINGNTYITGIFEGTADFDPGSDSGNLSSNGKDDIFLAKYDGSGNYLWAKSVGGPNDDRGWGIALEESGNVYITGSFQGTVDFDSGSGTAMLSSNGDDDIFLAKYDSSGNYGWAMNIGGTSGSGSGYSVALDGSGNAYITGFFQDTADFDPGSGTAMLSSNGDLDIFLAKYDSSGNYLWANNMGGGPVT